MLMLYLAGLGKKSSYYALLRNIATRPEYLRITRLISECIGSLIYEQIVLSKIKLIVSISGGRMLIFVQYRRF